MRIRDAFGIYHVLETLLKKSKEPRTCVDLFDHPDVKKFADSVNRVSDYLGHMYRRGLLGRVPAPKTLNSQARWAYFWKDRSEVTIEEAPKPPVAPAPLPATDHPQTVLSKPNISITDDGGTVVIDLPQLTITIRSK